MSMTRLASLFLFATQACVLGMPDTEPCPDGDEAFIEDGAYRSAGDVGVGPSEPTFPHQAAQRTLEVDRAAGTVTISWDRDGTQVVETWRIVGP
jgi:hypothetical protein